MRVIPSSDEFRLEVFNSVLLTGSRRSGSTAVLPTVSTSMTLELLVIFLTSSVVGSRPSVASVEDDPFPLLVAGAFFAPLFETTELSPFCFLPRTFILSNQ